MTLSESEHYFVMVGDSAEFKRPVYQSVNKETGVVEFETSTLFLAKKSLPSLEKAYEEDDEGGILG